MVPASQLSEQPGADAFPDLGLIKGSHLPLSLLSSPNPQHRFLLSETPQGPPDQIQQTNKKASRKLKEINKMKPRVPCLLQQGLFFPGSSSRLTSPDHTLPSGGSHSLCAQKSLATPSRLWATVSPDLAGPKVYTIQGTLITKKRMPNHTGTLGTGPGHMRGSELELLTSQ